MKIEKSETLRRNIRRDEGTALTVSTWDGVRAAIREGRIDDALAGIDYGCSEAKMMHDSMCSLADDALTRLAAVGGDDEVYKLIRARYEPFIKEWLSKTTTLKETIERSVEFQRGHFGKTEIREEADRFVVTCDPCGSGGQLRRTKKVGKAQVAHDWTWGKPDVPYYCTHCTVMWEILPTEMQGHPIRVNLPPEKDTDPCVHLYYKNPADIPDEYFSRIARPRKTGPLPPGVAPLTFVPPSGTKSGTS